MTQGPVKKTRGKRFSTMAIRKLQPFKDTVMNGMG